MHRSCVVCVLVADFDVEEIMEEFTMCMTNDIDKIRKLLDMSRGKRLFMVLMKRVECVESVLKPMEWILQENQ